MKCENTFANWFKDIHKKRFTKELVMKKAESELEYARESIYVRDDYTCQICNLNLKKKTSTKKNIDHIIPRSVFSWSHPFNLQLLCENCNADKGSVLPSNYWDVIENNIDRTLKWFVKQNPIFCEDKRKFEIWKLQMKLRDNYYPFSIDKYYEVFSLYYDDEYINGKTGVLDDDLNDAKELPNLCFSIFEEKMKTLIHNTHLRESIIIIFPEYRKTHKKKPSGQIAQEAIYWFQSLSYKLKAIGHPYLANECDRFENYLYDEYCRPRYVRRRFKN
jgi:hypothetical protein